MQTCRSMRDEAAPSFYSQLSFAFMPLKDGFETFIMFASTLSDFVKSPITTLDVYNFPMMPKLPVGFGTTLNGFIALQSFTLHRRSFDTENPLSRDTPLVRLRRLQSLQTLVTIQQSCSQLSRAFFQTDSLYDISVQKWEGIHQLTFEKTAANGPNQSEMEFRIDVKISLLASGYGQLVVRDFAKRCTSL